MGRDGEAPASVDPRARPLQWAPLTPRGVDSVHMVSSWPPRIAVVNDYEVVVRGVAAMLRAYRHMVEIVELDAQTPVATPVDIALYDTFAQTQGDATETREILDNPGGWPPFVAYQAAQKLRTESERQPPLSTIWRFLPPLATRQVACSALAPDGTSLLPSSRPVV